VDLTDDRLIETLRRMLRIRLFDERAAELHSKGLLPGSVHTSIGQEAAVVGACMAVRNDDYMTGYHRSHGHPIGKGSNVAPLMAELFGKATGICRGKGGSMHLADFAVGSLGESGIVGAGMPIAVGAALSAQMRGTDQVCLSFFGDGAANAGPFHESLNLAAIWNVPVIFLCENNGYAVTFSTTEAMKIENIADRAGAYGIPGVVVDGQDVLAVYAAMAEAVARARSGGGPTLIEAKTYRFHEHVEGVRPSAYRADDEIERWRARDPIALFRKKLIEGRLLDDAAADALEAEVAGEIADAVQFAQESASPTAEEALEDVFASSTIGTTAIAPAEEELRLSTYLGASWDAIAVEMRRDSNVCLMGQDLRVQLYGAFPVDEFPEDRVRSLPISENGFVGAGVGAAMTGLRPVINMTFATFLYSAMDQVVNQAAKLRYMSGGQARVPLVLIALNAYGGNTAAHHSDRPFALFANSPGLKIVAPSSPFDMKGLMATAVRDDDPVLVFIDSTLFGVKGPVPEDGYAIPLGLADVKREGSDVTIVAISGAVRLALAAAEKLADEGISPEVVDPRSLVPLDVETISASVAKTGRLVVVDPGPRTSGFGAEIVATLAETCELRAAPVRVAGANVPTPFSPALEQLTLPSADEVITAARRVLTADRTPV
jgi:2-oxoisovalerate dehydrogenase E1 component